MCGRVGDIRDFVATSEEVIGGRFYSATRCARVALRTFGVPALDFTPSTGPRLRSDALRTVVSSAANLSIHSSALDQARLLDGSLNERGKQGVRFERPSRLLKKCLDGRGSWLRRLGRSGFAL